MSHRSKRLVAIAAIASAVAGFTSACSTPTSSNGSRTADGSVEARKIEDLNVGFFMTTTANPYAAVFAESVKSEAKAAGVELTEIDSDLDVQTQINQMQQAIARKTYNAWIVVPSNGEQVCSQIKSAINAGIEVMIANGAACGGQDVGQVGFTGWQVPENEATWWKQILDDNSRAKVAFLAGPSTVGIVQSMKSSMDDAFAEHPDAELVSYINTDWSIEDGLSKTRELLRTNPETEVIVTSYAYLTKGVLQALEEAGRLGDIKIYDWAGDTWAVDQIRKGTVTLTVPGLPISEAVWSVRNLVSCWVGDEYEKNDSLFGHLDLKDGPFITNRNAGEYTAEYTT